jgi:hypothetical protein
MSTPSKRDVVGLGLVVLAAIALGLDAYEHLHLAKNYVHNGTSITQGTLFRIEAAIAIVVALALLLTDSRLVWLATAATGGGGVALVVLYRYVDVGKIGPIPDMYEPLWYRDKNISAIAEGALVLIWIVREIRRRQRASTPV